MPIMPLGCKHHLLGTFNAVLTVYIFPNVSNIFNILYACMFHHSEEKYTQINRKVILNSGHSDTHIILINLVNSLVF